MKPTARRLLALVMLCLFVSGMAGLVYEIVWTRYLALFLGHTSYAVVAVLVAFMGGLALGNVLIGSLADRTPRPLALYGWIEIGIGAYALIFPYYDALCHAGFVRTARALQSGSTGLLALKFGFSILTILAPTILMGGTLPLVTRLLTRRLGEVREKVAALYFINSAGAVVGTWLADFWWLETIGLESSLLAGACMNLGVGALALFVSGWLKEGRSAAPEQAAPVVAEPAPEETFSRGELRLALAGIALSGFVAMLYQVAWTRMLALVLGSSTHAFSLMLITFIAGIAVGSWIVFRWSSLRRTLVAFAWTELALAATLAVTMFSYEHLPFLFMYLGSMLARQPESYPLYEFVQGLICVGVMFIPTVCLGMTLPLVSRVGTADAASAGRSVGRVFAVNTLGTVLGAAVTGLVLLPWLGLARTFALGIATNVLIGLAILLARQLPRHRELLAAMPLLAALLVVGAGRLFDRAWQGTFTLGLWRHSDRARTWSDVRAASQMANLPYYRDGAGATVSVHKFSGHSEHLSLKVNGKADASTTGDMITQLLLGHVPMLLHPAPKEALVIGLGSGMTAGATTAHRSLERLDLVEISPEVVQAARLFGPHNRRVLDCPYLRLVVEDAKSFLQITDRSYDVIISEPSNPWMAGVAGVFSLEFYENCRAHMRPRGLMVQWVQLYEFSDNGLDIVLGTFSKVFPYLSLWQSHRSDLLLVGSAEPWAGNLETLVARLKEPAVKEDLDRVNISNPALFLSHEMVSPENGRFIPAVETRLHTDYYPVLEYVAQRDFFARPTVERFRQVDENFSRRATTLLASYVKAHGVSLEDYQAFAQFYIDQDPKYVDLFASLLLRWRREYPEALEPLEHATRFRFLSTPGELEALRYLGERERILERAKKHPQLLRQYGTALMRAYREQRSLFYAPPTAELRLVLERLLETDQDNQRVYQGYLAELAWDELDDEACVRWARRAIAPDAERGKARFKLDPQEPLRAVARLAEVYWRQGNRDSAARLCQETVRAGFIDEKTRYDALPFEFMTRKVLGGMTDTTPAAGQ
jgi:spermidine synthase